jgi:hypothetical protein
VARSDASVRTARVRAVRRDRPAARDSVVNAGATTRAPAITRRMASNVPWLRSPGRPLLVRLRTRQTGTWAPRTVTSG